MKKLNWKAFIGAEANWKNLPVSIAGTAIGIALTFGLNSYVKDKQTEESKRLMAIMIIHDIDESIEKLRDDLESDSSAIVLAQNIFFNDSLIEHMAVDNDTLI